MNRKMIIQRVVSAALFIAITLIPLENKVKVVEGYANRSLASQETDGTVKEIPSQEMSELEIPNRKVTSDLSDEERIPTATPNEKSNENVLYDDFIMKNEITKEISKEVKKKIRQKRQEEERKQKEAERKRKEAEKKRKIEEAKKQRNREIEKVKNFSNELLRSDATSCIDMSKNLGISKNVFVEVLQSLTCDYVGFYKENADELWEIAKEHDFNEFLLPGIIAKESGWGRHQSNKYNFTGQRIGGNRYYAYDSVRAGLEAVANNLSNNYLRKGGKYNNGTTLNGINVDYCEPSGGNKFGWASEVKGCIRRIMRDYGMDG